MPKGFMRKFDSQSPLDDPETAAHAWARYRRIMRFMFALTVGVVILAVATLYAQNGPVSVHFYIAVALGIGFSMLLASALMGLIFLSNGTGHDASVDNELPNNDPDSE
jgi:membrane glycosyltransferase